MISAYLQEEIPAEVIAESIALAQRQQEVPRAELTSLELALFEDAKAEHSTAVPASEEQAEHSSSELVEQAELPVSVPKAGVEVAATVHDVVVEVLRATGVLVVITSPMKRPIVVMPIHSLPGSSVPLPMLIQSWQNLRLWIWTPSWINWRNSVLLLAKPSPWQWRRLWRD
ncbi:unnamed protein product [Prunus armeniaca]